MTNAQQAKDVATKDVTNGKSKVQAADAAVKSAQDNQQQVAAQVAATNTKLSQDRAALETASQAVTAAKQGVKQAQDNIVALQNALPMFNFTSEQIATTKALAQEIATDIANYQYLGTYTIQNANAFQNWANAMTNSQIQSDLDMGRFNDYFKQIASTYNNWTDNLQKDRDETVNLKNVTADQANELSIFTADLLNKIANQLGISGIVSKEVATVGASELANEVVKLCEKDGKSDGHYIYALHQAYYDHGLANTPASDSEKNTMGENDYGESLSTYFSSNLSSEMSMAEVKQQLVQVIAGMLFVDKGSMMGHAISMCGLDNIYNANKEQVIGVAPSFVETNDDNALSFHINQPQSDLLDSANSKQAGITTPLQTGKPSDGKAELAQAQATLAAKEKDAAAKQTAVDEDNTELTQLNKDLAAKKQKTQQAQAQLDTASDALKGSQTALTSAQDKITAANAALAKAQARLQTAQQAVATATQDVAKAQKTQQDKQTALNNAQTKLNSEQNKLDTINQQLKAQQANLTTAQQAATNGQQTVAAATQALTKSQAKLQNLQNQLQAMQGQTKAIQEAQTALTKATAALTAAEQELQKQQAALVQLKKTVSDNQAKVADAQANLKKAQTTAAAAKNALAKANAELANAQPDSVKYGKLVKIKAVVITVGDKLPNPIIDNGSIVVDTPSTQSIVLMTLAAASD